MGDYYAKLKSEEPGWMLRRWDWLKAMNKKKESWESDTPPKYGSSLKKEKGLISQLFLKAVFKTNGSDIF